MRNSSITIKNISSVTVRPYENPSPGNPDGGITTLEDKSRLYAKAAAVLLSGTRYGDRVDAGTRLLDGPGNDMVAIKILLPQAAI